MISSLTLLLDLTKMICSGVLKFTVQRTAVQWESY